MGLREPMIEVRTRFKVELKPREKRRDQRPGMDSEYLRAIRKLPSCISGRMPCEAHHLRIKGERGVGLKATDQWAVPLTHHEHVICHSIGSKVECQWFRDRGVEVIELAKALWTNRHSEETMMRILLHHRR